MTSKSSPITPPPELVGQWLRDRELLDPLPLAHHYLATRAAQWGADQELEACCEALHQRDCAYLLPSQLRAARRPKPPSLKEQALEQLGCIQIDLNKFGMGISTDTIRRALEALPND
jgi:hypothetical protein